MNNIIEDLVVRLSTDPFNPEINFQCAVEYENLNQTASAVSFYLRAAEYGLTSHPEIVYSSLLKMAKCFNDQNDRIYTVTNCYLQAISYLPNRPEAYFLMSQFNEKSKNWQECYTWAELGLFNSSKNLKPLPINIEYYGEYCLKFEKAISSWWIGRKDEGVHILLELNSLTNIDPIYKMSVQQNLKHLGVSYSMEIDPLEPVITNYRKFFGNTANIIIDIGTREGDDANYLYNHLNGRKVLAIDANPSAIKLAKITYPWMDIKFAAVSDYDGETKFYQVNSPNKELAGCSSMASKEKTMFPEDFAGILNELTVPTIRMDSLLKEKDIYGPVDVVKIDTEGFSWQVLQGFGDRLKDVKLLHVETEKDIIHDNHVLCEEITIFMKSQGFILADISYEWGPGIQDQVWVNPNLAIRNKEFFNDII